MSSPVLLQPVACDDWKMRTLLSLPVHYDIREWTSPQSSRGTPELALSAHAPEPGPSTEWGQGPRLLKCHSFPFIAVVHAPPPITVLSLSFP